MANLKANHLHALRHRHPGYASIGVFVETGTYLAASSLLARRQFPVVHSVEISPALHARAVELYGAIEGLHFYLGDSRAFVQRLARELTDRVVWYLDAHWFRKTVEPVGGRAEGLPLWDELDALAARPAGDLVLVDDVHSFGTASPTPEWLGVTLDTIAARLPGHREAVILGDQAAVYR